ncbi:TonB-dependent receptor [Mucilaginibacter sp. BJC16-A38]|uniref:TonB-dependent receptor n=1 Tax=Mucilaginibacter phenanthrenivorans TaxID=1234842 RepID=UPI0021584D5D|nr:TonB-dependent receptor [Mucilaginibacter phenanthrenivorans]MCR8561019.1 TonB-dependent receptor [Mucilaginibacter phenanthrenivorans]
MPVYSQVDHEATNSILEKFQKYSNNNVLEKAYLQFDKPYYSIGDTIYFKGYLTIGGNHKLSALSGVLHAELINPEGKIVRAENLQVMAGTSWGDFALADTLKGGTYVVRAYTNWMRNEGENSFFEKAITVGSFASAKKFESGERQKNIVNKKQEQPKRDVQFMPEGGTLVAGNYSKIAFKAIGANGSYLNIKGTITDETGNELASFSSAHAGMGSFTFVPEAGKTYKANIVYDDGTHDVVVLPKTTETGYTINVNNNSADTLRIRVTAATNNTTDKLSLIARAGGTIYYAAENQQTGAKFFSAIIPKNKFPTGIVQFTLYSPEKEPLNERLVFIDNHDELKLGIKSRKQKYKLREKVNVELNVYDKTNMPEMGSFSISVTDETRSPADTANENCILSYLLLTSDLKGYVDTPAYYFRNNSEQTQNDLDNLLLTQGYRHFEWKEIGEKEQSEPQYQAEKAFTISGMIKRNGKPAIGAKVSLISKTNGFFMIDTIADNNGRFAFKDLIFADSTKFLVQSKVTKGQDDVTVELDTLPPANIDVYNRSLSTKQDHDEKIGLNTYTINQKQFYEEQQKYGINKHAVVLKEVHIEAKKETTPYHSENLNGAGGADQTLTVKQLERMNCSKLTYCLSGMLSGVIFRGALPLNLRDHQAIMAIIVDGTFLELPEYEEVFNSLHPEDIESIEVILGPHYGAIYGDRMAHGGLIITTKRGRKTKNYYRYAPGVITYMPKGFYKAREFYSPQYDNPKTNQKMADLRSTIYWNPNIITDKDGKASFSFFNADGKGTYRVVVEGIDVDGNLGRQVYRYKVE